MNSFNHSQTSLVNICFEYLYSLKKLGLNNDSVFKELTRILGSEYLDSVGITKKKLPQLFWKRKEYLKKTEPEFFKRYLTYVEAVDGLEGYRDKVLGIKQEVKPSKASPSIQETPVVESVGNALTSAFPSKKANYVNYYEEMRPRIFGSEVFSEKNQHHQMYQLFVNHQIRNEYFISEDEMRKSYLYIKNNLDELMNISDEFNRIRKVSDVCIK